MSFPTTGVLDDFQRADETLDSGNWSASTALGLSGALEIVGGRMVAPASFSGNLAGSNWTFDESLTRGEAYLTGVEFDPSELDGTPRVDLRLTDDDGLGYILSYQYVSRATWNLYRVDPGGSFDHIGSTVDVVVNHAGFGLRVLNGRVEGWHQSPAGAWAKVMESPDDTYSTFTQAEIWLREGGSAEAFGGGEWVDPSLAGPPARPTGLTATTGFQRNVLQWTANTEGDLAGYRVYRSEDGGAFTLLGEVENNALIDNTIEDGKTYSYHVTAFDTDDNESDPSDTVTPVAPTPAPAFTPSPAARWEWVLADHNGANLCSLVTAHGKTIRYRRNSYAEASCTISYEDAAGVKLWAALQRGIPRLKCYRDGELVFYGHLSPFQAEFEEATNISLVFRSPFAQLLGEGESRGRWTKNYLLANNEDAGQIAADLIRLYGGAGSVGGSTVFTDADGGVLVAASGYVGLDVGSIATTVDRYREYRYANVGEEIVNLTNVDQGFDFFEDFTDDGLHMADFVVVAEQGEDRPGARFQYGETTARNVRSVAEVVEPPLNVVRVFGPYAMTAMATNAQSVGTWGEHWFQATFNDVFSEDGLTAKAEALLRPFPIVTLSWTPEYGVPGCPRPWDDFWLGDSVRFYGRRGAWERSASARVNEISVVVDQDGFEAAEIPSPLDPESERVLRAQLAVEVVP